MDFLHYIFAFNDKSPLLFTQFYFWAFFAIVYAGFALIMDIKTRRRKKEPFSKQHINQGRLHVRNVFLMLVSWFFYYKTSGNALAILAFVTCSDWIIAKQIYRANQNRKHWAANIWLTISVLIDLSFLCYFKYAYFGVDVANTLLGTHFSIVDKIILPVGISFYTFQVISYTTDVYRGKVSPVDNLLDFGFFVSFFPQLVAGPIVRASEFIPQLYKPFFLGRRQFGMAVFWILNGLMKKIILSDYLAVNLIDRVFDNPLLFTGFENLFALFAYSLQVYADFSGYTDIAIGVAMLMGFYLPKNFDSPYKSRNPQEFWRRWHQSLSRWLKGYVYIPLGGNRTLLGIKTNKLFASNVNSFLTMLIGGLWHGASWNFIIWGGLNGIGMIISKSWAALKEKLGITTFIGRRRFLSKMEDITAIALTFTFITFTRLFFRSGSNLDPATQNEVAWRTARQMMGQIVGAWNSAIIPDFLNEYRVVVILFILGMIIHWLPTHFKRWYRIQFALMPLWLVAICVVAVVFIVYQFITADMQPFIYFQF